MRKMGLFSGSASLVPKPHTLNSLAQKMADNEILSLFAGFHYCQDTWPPFSIRGEKKLAHDDLIDQDSKVKTNSVFICTIVCADKAFRVRMRPWTSH